MRTGRVGIAKLLTVLWLGLTLAIPAAADSNAHVYAGYWEGNGLLTVGARGPAKRGRCKVEVVAAGASDELNMEGVCAVAAGRSRFKMRTLWIDDTTLRAGFRANGLQGTSQYRGTYSVDRIELWSSEPVELDGQLFQSHLVIDFASADEFRVNEWIRPQAGGAARHIVSLVFKRNDLQD